MVHGLVFRQHLAGNFRQFFHPADFDETFEQFKSESLAVPVVADQHGEFTFVHLCSLLKRPTPRIFFSPSSSPVLMFGDEGDLAVIIVEANARETFMRDALRQFQPEK